MDRRTFLRSLSTAALLAAAPATVAQFAALPPAPEALSLPFTWDLHYRKDRMLWLYFAQLKHGAVDYDFALLCPDIGLPAWRQPGVEWLDYAHSAAQVAFERAVAQAAT